MFKKYDFIKSIVQMSGACGCSFRFLVIEELSPLDSAEFKVIYRPPRAPVKKLKQNMKGLHWWTILELVPKWDSLFVPGVLMCSLPD